MIQDGWVCRACWKPNRPQDDRCYRCKTQREEQLTVTPGSEIERTAPGATLRGRMDAEMPILAAIVAWPMWLSGVLVILVAAFSFLLAIIAGDRVDPSGNSSRLVLIITAAVLAVVGLLWMFISRSVRRHARWAYAIAIVVYLLPSAPALLGLVEVPSQVDLPDWSVALQTILSVIYVLLGICAVFLLATSFMKSDEGQDADTREPS